MEQNQKLNNEVEQLANQNLSKDQQSFARFRDFLSGTSYNQRLQQIQGDANKSNLWTTSVLGRFANKNRFYFHYHNQPMPETQDIFPWTKYIHGLYYYLKNFADPTIAKLATTKISREILDKIELKLKSGNIPTHSKRLKYFGLSGHEYNLFPFLMGYGLVSKECIEKNLLETDPSKLDPKCVGSPDASSNLIWEVSKKKREISDTLGLESDIEYFVRVIYNGQVVDFCKAEAETPQGYCTFSKFKEHFENHFIMDEKSF